MRLSRSWGVLTVAVLFFIVPTGTALAECASPPPLETALAETTVAFVGEVAEAQFDSTEASIRVVWIWKGDDLPEEVAVHAPSGSGVSFRVGVTYIVIPEDARAPFELGECSGTRIYRADGETIPDDLHEAVGSVSGVARRPGDLGSPDNDSGMGWLPIAAALTLAAMVVIGVYWLKPKSSESTEREDAAASGSNRGGWRRVGGPLSWSARSGDRQLGRMRRSRRNQHGDTEE